TLAGTMTVENLHTASIGTITGNLNISGSSSGDSISIGTQNGTVDATHLVNYSVNTMGGTTSVGTLSTGTIGTMTNSSTLTVSSPNSGDSISIGTKNGTLNATHLVNYSVNTMGGTTSVGTLSTGTIGTMTNSSTLTGSTPNSGDTISIATQNVTVVALHVALPIVNTMGGTTSVGTLSTGTIGTMTNSSTLTVSSPNSGDS